MEISILLLVYKVEAVRCRVEVGTKAGHVICDVANQEEAVMVVLGTRNVGKHRRRLLGGVGDYVLGHSPCPVMVCPGD